MEDEKQILATYAIEDRIADLCTADILLYYLETDIEDNTAYIKNLNDKHLFEWHNRISLLSYKIREDISSIKTNLERNLERV